MQELQFAKNCTALKGDQVDLSWLAIDHLSEAMKLTKTLHSKTYCQARLMEGDIFLNTVNNKVKATTYFEDIVKNHKSTEEYVDAKFNRDQLKVENKREETTAKQSAGRGTISHEIGELRDAVNITDEDFAQFVFSKFPPKHKADVKMPDLKDKKKAFFRLSSFYHPDKVDEQIWGSEYKMRCGVISKQFNSRYTKMK